jgi:8-oxo-dGTP pyrophosphatase MutT (NUDIX family)
MHDRFDKILSLLEKIPNEVDIKQNARLASVVIILIQDTGQESRIVLIKRTQYDGHHSEQMAFPGGKKDISDSDLSVTARREVCEEIGIDLDESELISLNPHWIPISNYWIQPYYVEIDKKLDYTLNKREINSIFEIPVSFFMDPAHLNFHELHYNDLRVESPRYLYEGHEIWGATALIIYQFIKLIDSKLI